MRKLSFIVAVLGVIALQPTSAFAYGAGVPPVTGLGTKVGRVLGISTKAAVPSNTDRQAADYIKFNQAPTIVKHAFNEVFGRSLTHNESVYWKSRARGDKATESKLKDAMIWHKSVGSFGPKQNKATKIEILKNKLGGIFNSVYSRNPNPSEHKYWLTRVADKVSVQAMAQAMLFHLWNGITH